jgi:ankyrin repeat protein
VRLLLGHKADVNVKDNDGWTAKHRAVENGHETEVRLLLKHKADVDANDDGRTENGHEAEVRLLLGHMNRY